MAITNHERVGKMLELLTAGLQPFVERELKTTDVPDWFAETRRSLADAQLQLLGTPDKPQWDAAAIIVTMWNQWNSVFRKTLGHAERTLVSELREVRNRWAHQRPFSTDDAYRALDSAARLLTAVSAPEANDVEKMKMELLRVRFDEQVRTEKRRAAGATIETQAQAGLKPWREVVHPHKDVASGKYQQAEFAADLWQVYLGEGSDEYRKPVEFFRRTYLTESLTGLLAGAAQRLTSAGGDPVVQLQTNFGGGKTHSMLALYHMFSGTPHSDLLGVDGILKTAGVDALPKVNRVVLVGNKISPGNPVTKPDGTVVRTLWGELAWQLGFARGGAKEAKKAFQRVAADDERATSPGDMLRALMNDYGPCVILIDEWVAYARQLHDQGDLPGGSFETHFTFAQALTESAKAATRCLLVISLPASDSGGSLHTQTEDIEVGGERGRTALDRLHNAVGRVESSWRPASAEEGFEIVRRRLFEPLVDREQYVARDLVAKAFFDLYRTQSQEFPPECHESGYEARLKAAYPIHPEVFDRLYNDWSSLAKFQRTRGVLRLMASVIHALWERGDRSPLILPSSLPIDDHRVLPELTSRYLSDNWVPVIEKDVDGPNSLPLRFDGETPNLGKYSACRRVARTVYLGSAPTTKAANKGIDDRRIKLGCVMPGEASAIFGDALRRLSAAATFLYQDSVRYWYSTQPTVTKLADDRAEQLKGDPDAVAGEVGRWVRNDLQRKGDFSRVHPLPRTSGDVQDDKDARLVVFGIEYPHAKDTASPALAAAQEFLQNRGTAPRIYRNTLVFLAADKTRLQDLDEAVRQYLAWSSIVDEAEKLNLDPHQTRQAVSRQESAHSAVAARLPETYQWLIVPTQAHTQATVEWQAFRLIGQDALAVRAGKKLRNDELLISGLAASRLRLDLDQVPLWRGDHVSIQLLTEDFARYLYLPRLRDTGVLVEAIRGGLGLLTWSQDSFAYAESFDEAAGRYRGLQAGRQLWVDGDHPIGLLVKPEAAQRQLAAEAPPPGEDTIPSAGGSKGGTAPTTGRAGGDTQPPATPSVPTRFHGVATLDSKRVGRDAGRIADEVVAHLAGIVGANVKVTLEIEADIPSGAPDHVVRTVTENCRTLKFDSHGFEKE